MSNVNYGSAKPLPKNHPLFKGWRISRWISTTQEEKPTEESEKENPPKDKK